MKRFVIKLFVVFCSVLFFTDFGYGYQTEFSDNFLLKDANAVVRDYSIEFIQSDINNASVVTHKVITILNKEGSDYGHFIYSGSKFMDLSDFKGVIKDATGKEIRKIKKSDLTKTNISEEMSSDMHMYFYEYNSPSYPFTIEYSYKEKWKNGIIMYPPFVPLEGYQLALEKASYKITVPKEVGLRYRINYDFDIRHTETGGIEEYIFAIDNISPIVTEPLAPEYRKLFPRVLLAPSQFCYDSHCGNMESWENYGEWVNFLLKDRDNLPENFSSEVVRMTSGTTDVKEKAKILYEYLQNNFRYVSIQLGIGGFQPMDATKVVNTRFGDCKALTNLYKAMLQKVGIPSYYCEISTREKDLYTDFTNVSQTNHVILLIPFDTDSIWVECTSSDLPFGYIHNGISGKDALVMTEQGGKICKLPQYSDSQNYTASSIMLKLNADGNIDGNIHIKEYLSNYQYATAYLRNSDRENQIRYLNRSVNIPNIHVGEIKLQEAKTDIPYWEVDASFVTDRYVNKTGKRIFIPICPLRKVNLNVFTSSSRIYDIVVSRGYSEQDTIVFELPDSYIPESLPKDIDMKTQFGNYSTKLLLEGNKATYTQQIEIFSGEYDKDLYPEIKKFFTDIMAGINRKMVFKLEES